MPLYLGFLILEKQVMIPAQPSFMEWQGEAPHNPKKI